MDNGLIPHRYAKALFKYALEQEATRKVYDTANAVIKAFEENPGLQKVLSNPFVKNEDKRKLLLTAPGFVTDEAYGRFVSLVIDHKREEFFYLMMLAYAAIYREHHHIIKAHIKTAIRLQDAEMVKIREIVTKGFKDSKIEFDETIDPAIIGGFIIDVDDVRMDASVRHELEQLRQTLLRSK